MKNKVILLINFLSKPLSSNEDAARKEFILNIILLSIIFLFVLSNLILAYNLSFKHENFDPEQILSIKIAFSILLFFCFLLFLNKKGYFLASAFSFLIIFFLFSVSLVLKWGVGLPPALLFFILTIVISGILISSRFSFIAALTSFITIFILNYLEVNGISKPNLSWQTESWSSENVITLGVVLLIIASLSWLSNREIDKSLKRARKSEQELKNERDLLEIKVIERTKDLEESKLKEISQFHRLAEFGKLSADLFHELANPLTALNLNIESFKNCLEYYPDGKNFAHSLDQATKAAKRIGSLISSIKNQISQKNELSYFSVNQEIEDIIEIFNFKARKNRVCIIFEAEKEHIIFGSALDFYRVISNLVSNAIDSYQKYNPNFEGHKNLNEIEKRRVLIVILEDEENIFIKVIDRGRGIDKKIQEKIWQAFFSTKNRTEGSGLGLSISKKIIEECFSGKINLESEVEKGSTFTVVLKKLSEKSA